MSSENAQLSLTRAFGIKSGDIVSLVGGGGKTTTMYYIAGELAKKGLKVIVTTTTHIFPPEITYTCLTTKDINEVKEALKENNLVVLADSVGEVKLEGIDPLWVNDLKEVADVIIVEADGSRNLPFKAPHEHEPVVPPSSTVVIPVVGVDAVYKPLSEEWAHRPDKISEITGLKMGEPVTPEIIATTLLHTMGGMKGVPSHAAFIPLINKADSQNEVDIAMEISSCLFQRGVNKVIITSHKGENVFIKPCMHGKSVSAVILAAGASSRMGKQKLELEIGGKNLTTIVLENVEASTANEIILVIKPDHVLIDDLEHPGIKTVINEKWQTGQSSSMKAGLETVNPEAEAVIFLMADQPMVTPEIINKLLLTFYETDKPIVAPLYNGQKGAPVLFNKSMFDDLRMIEGDMGGRDLLNKYPVEYVEIDSPLAGIDVDTPEDYQRLKGMIDV